MIRPLSDGIVVQPVETAAVIGGLHIPQSARKRSNEGTIVAVGPGRWESGERVPMECAIGDRILYMRWAGYKIEAMGGKDLICCKESDILCIADEDEVLGFEGLKSE